MAEGAAYAASITIQAGQIELEELYYAQCFESLCADCGTCSGLYQGVAIRIQQFITSPQILAQIDAFFLGGEQ